MARLARVVVPGLPHHVTQRGNGGARTFFRDEDYAFYRDLLARYANEAGVEVWAWVLMPNHVHLVLNPADPDGLRRALSRIHRTYAGYVHGRQNKTGITGRFDFILSTPPTMPYADCFPKTLANPPLLRSLRQFRNNSD